MLKTRKLTLGSFQTNCYFIIDESTAQCLIVDPAYDADAISAKLGEYAVKPCGILLTHAHFDHIMALEDLREKYGIPVMLAKEENAMLTDSRMNMLDFYGDGSSCAPADRLLEDGDVIKLGDNEIKVMLLPGHTPGSCAYIYGDTMISGDTLFREGIGRYDFPGGDYFKLRESLKKIAALDVDYKIYPGHGASTTLEHEKTYNINLQ